jgi:hypothetical protein
MTMIPATVTLPSMPRDTVAPCRTKGCLVATRSASVHSADPAPVKVKRQVVNEGVIAARKLMIEPGTKIINRGTIITEEPIDAQPGAIENQGNGRIVLLQPRNS